MNVLTYVQAIEYYSDDLPTQVKLEQDWPEPEDPYPTETTRQLVVDTTKQLVVETTRQLVVEVGVVQWARKHRNGIL